MYIWVAISHILRTEKLFCCTLANHASTNLKKFLSWKLEKLLYLRISSSAETWKVFTNMLSQFFPLKLTFEGKKFRILESIFFAKQELITRTKLLAQHFGTGKKFSFNQWGNKEICFFHWESYFVKAIENPFYRVCIAWSYKHSRGWENYRQLQTLNLVSGAFA